MNQPDTKVAAEASPYEEYTRRLKTQQQRAAELSGLERMLGNGRVVVFLIAVILGLLVLATGALSPLWPTLPFLGFCGLVVWYEQTLRAGRRARRIAAFYERGLARLEDRWSGGGEQGPQFLNPDHPNAVDLDLFGPGSVFELLCTARTRSGEETLAAWLLGPAAPEEIRARQAAVQELRPRLDLREDLALLGANVRAGIDPNALARWGAGPRILLSGRAPLVGALLSGMTVTTLLTSLTTGLGVTPCLLSLIAQGVFAQIFRARVRRVIGTVDRAARDLNLLGGILARLEKEPFTTPKLRELRAALDTDGQPPSERLYQLARLIERLNSRRNQFFAPIALLLLWSTQIAFALEKWRAVSGAAVARWLAVVGEFEALGAFAGFAYENPVDPFPEIVDAGPLFDGAGLGHPLLPKTRCVRNDLRLDRELRVLIVSGSNMSGKSTLLRTVGVNTVLALAGATVRAHKLRISPLRVGATLRIQDSLQAGRSRFYSEITRMRQLVELAKGAPSLLFLLDEILHGTNSHDRRLGAQAVVRGLVQAGAIGLVTTHDLALAHIADLLAPHAANVHFEDHFENGTMTFDYRMRPGVVEKSNALALMRAIGLEV